MIIDIIHVITRGMTAGEALTTVFLIIMGLFLFICLVSSAFVELYKQSKELKSIIRELNDENHQLQKQLEKEQSELESRSRIIGRLLVNKNSEN